VCLQDLGQGHAEALMSPHKNDFEKRCREFNSRAAVGFPPTNERDLL
jgi:hypothetical protein